MIPLEARERIPFFCMAIAAACAASGALVARAAADTLFLEHYGTDLLSLMYVSTGLLVGILAYSFARRSRSVGFSRTLLLSCGFLILSAIGLRIGLLFPWHGVRILTYVWGDISVTGSMFLFWGFFGQVFNARQARKLIGWIGATGTLACIAFGFLLRPYTRSFGTQNLLLLVALLLFGFAASVFYLERHLAQLRGLLEMSRSEVKMSEMSYYFQLLVRPRIQTLALQAMLGTVVVVLVDYQFKVVSQSRYEGPALAAFFGTFYGVTNILVLGLQLFALHRLLQGKGLLTSLRVLPSGLLLGGSATFLTASFWAAVGTKAIAQTTLFTIESGAFQILYLGIKHQTRYQVRALIDGICKPMATSVVGAVLLLVSGAISVYVLALPGVLLCFLWLFLARRNYTLYIQGLIDNLNAKLLDFSGECREMRGKAVEIYTRKALRSAPVENLPYLIGVVRQLDDIDWSPEIRSLLRRPEAAIKVAALEYLRDSQYREGIEEIVECVRHSDAGVRRAAVRAASIGGEVVLNPIRETLVDPDPRVRAEAASALIEIGHFGGLVEGVVAVKAMLESEDKIFRSAVASPLSRLRLRGRTQFLLRLLHDPEPEVRLAALSVSANVPDAALVPAVITHLWDKTTADAAAEALAALGPLTVDHLRSTPEDRELAAILSRSDRLPLVLAKIGGLQALGVIRRVLDTANSRATSGVIQAYCRILERQHQFNPHLMHWESVTRCQIEAAYRRKEMLTRAASLPGNTLLLRALREECERHIDHIFLLVGVRATSVRMAAIRARVNSDNEEERTDALELLEHVIPANLRTDVMGLLNDGKGDSSAAASSLSLELLDSETSEPIILGAIYAVFQSGDRDALPLVRKYFSEGSGFVSEMAQFTVARMEGTQSVLTRSKSFSGDPIPQGSSRAELVSTTRTGPAEGGGNMILAEKMVFLGNVPLFSNIETSKLMHIASLAREVSYPEGAQIIQEGEYGDRMFLIVDGEVRVQRGQTQLKVLGPKEFFGEMSIVDGEPRSATVTAGSDCFLLQIDMADFHDLISTYSSVALSVIRVLTQRLREALPVLERVNKGM